MKLRLDEIRYDCYLTQKEVAEKLGISKSYYNYFETGERIIPVPRLNDYCNTFNVTFDYVLGLSDKQGNPPKDFQLNSKVISERLKDLRVSHNMSQKDMSDILNTSQSTISAYEGGKTIILTAFLYQVCTKFNVSADYIVGRSNNREIK